MSARRRLLILGLLVAVPIEMVAAALLPHIPRIGVPQDINPWFHLAGDLTASLHAPWLILSDFLCAKYCPPSYVLQGMTIAGGYLDSVVLVVGVAALVRWYRGLDV